MHSQIFKMAEGDVPIGISRCPEDERSFIMKMKGLLMAGRGKRGQKIPMRQGDIERVCSIVKPIIQSEPILLEVKSPTCVVGDVHGQFHDLLRICESMWETNGSFLFLGDYVDRGPHSIEVLTLLFVLKALYPERYFLLRGNHEDEATCSKFTFRQEVLDRYNVQLFAVFVDIFNHLPIAAIIDGKDFCVHGGLCRGLFAHGISHIRQLFEPIQRPIEVSDSTFVNALLWADPKPDQNHIRSVGFSPSKRGGDAQAFGHSVTDRFLARFEFEKVIRGHQLCPNGMKEDHDGKVLTVFAAPNYCGTSNVGGYALIDKYNSGHLYHHFIHIHPIGNNK